MFIIIMLLCYYVPLKDDVYAGELGAKLKSKIKLNIKK